MSTIRPDQLPVPAGVTPVSPTPLGPTGAAGRARSPRLAAAGLAGLTVVALGVAALGVVAFAGSGSADGTATDRRSADERDADRDDDPDAGGGNATENPFELSGDDGTDDQGVDPDDQGVDPDPAPAGNASVDLDAVYTTLFGVAPSASTSDCLAVVAAPVIADVQALVDATATSDGQVVNGLSPFAECVPAADFDAALSIDIVEVVAPNQLDAACVSSVLATFVPADRLDVLATAALDPAAFSTRLFDTFIPCAV